MKNINPQIIISKALNGDQNAFTQILDLYWKQVYLFIRNKTSNEKDAEDITIETFSKAFQNLNQYNSKYNFSTWLFTIAKNIHIDLLRKQINNQTVDFEKEQSILSNIADSSPSVEDQLISQQQLDKVYLYIQKLSPTYREVFTLKFIKELSYKEISDITGEDINNIKVKILRAKKLLSELIKENQ